MIVKGTSEEEILPENTGDLQDAKDNTEVRRAKETKDDKDIDLIPLKFVCVD